MQSVRLHLLNITSSKPTFFSVITVVITAIIVVPVILPHITDTSMVYHILLHLVSITYQHWCTNKYLTPIAPANATNSNSNIANYLSQLKNAVNNKASFMNVMELVHVKLHPTLIGAYHPRLNMLGLNMPSKGSPMSMNMSGGNRMSAMNMPSKGSSKNMNKQ